jgi:hypothetical protein
MGLSIEVPFGGYRVLYRETHTLLDELAEATLDGTRKEHMEFLVTCKRSGVSKNRARSDRRRDILTSPTWLIMRPAASLPRSIGVLPTRLASA